MHLFHGAVVSIALSAICIGAYLVFGPATPQRTEIPTSTVFLNVFMHANPAHLLTNICILIIGGRITELAIGIGPTLLIVAACIVLGTYAQIFVFDANFAGISGPAYGLASFAIIARTPQKRLLPVGLIIACLLAFEVVLLSEKLAVFVHLISASIGGITAMFKNPFGNSEPKFKPMDLTHLSQVIAIIEETDEDDAAEAKEDFLDGGMAGMFVLVQKGQVLGVAGFSLDEQVHDIAWLSWTYLTKTRKGEGLGSRMMNEMLGKLKEQSIRKLFIATSDYQDFGPPIYADAHAMYEDFGAQVELTIPKYHGPREARIVYGLSNPEYVADLSPPAPTQTGISILKAKLDPETSATFVISWEEAPVGLRGMEAVLEKARKNKAHMVILAIPSDISADNSDALKAQGFSKCGKLADYYSIGLHQISWACSMIE